MDASIAEITQWLKTILASENLSEFSVDLVGTTGKGDGYTGDVIFIKVLSKDKQYDLALKCSKKSEAMRKSLPIKELFANEIFIYSSVLPAFRSFQESKGITEFSESALKYYGSFVSSNIEILGFEDLRVQGYKLWDGKIKPLTIEHVEVVLKEYGKFHATSAAMQLQHPEEFKKLVNGLHNGLGDMDLKIREQMFSSAILKACDNFQDRLSSDVQARLKNVCSQIKYITDDLLHKDDCFRVIVHGDCWNNNFLYKSENNKLKAAILDWQVSVYGNPVLDLAYYLYASLSYDSIHEFDRLLELYYDHFSKHLLALGSDPDIYPFAQLKNDWSEFGKYGFILSVMATTAVLGDPDEVPDFKEMAEEGKDLGEAFDIEIKDKTAYAKKVLFIIEHAAEKGVI